MTDTADVVIIGGGIVGSSIAYHLTDLGCTNLLLIEREAHQGLGSTAKSMGGVRAQFSTPINIRMSLYSIDCFLRFEDLTGHTAGYRPHGYLFLATEERHLDYLNANRELQLHMGVKVNAVTPADIAQMIPQVRVDDVIGGSYCPTDGFVDPYSVMNGFAARARQRGARLWLNTEVTGIEVKGAKVQAVNTTRGRVVTGTVVNACGPWAAEIAALAGVEIPVRPLKRQLVLTQPFDRLPDKFPMVIDLSTGFHFRREGPGILLAWPEPEHHYGFNTEFDHDFIEKTLTHAVHRAPVFAEAEVNPSRCWAGLYEMTPDHHPIIGPVESVAGLYVANGFSGHGVMHSPVTGRLTAEWILYGEPRLFDATPLQLKRFATGTLLHETAVL